MNKIVKKAYRRLARYYYEQERLPYDVAAIIPYPYGALMIIFLYKLGKTDNNKQKEK